MLEVLLDTNILLLPQTNKIDIFSEIRRLIDEPYELKVPQVVLQELEGLIGPSRDGLAAKVGMKLLESKDILIIPSEGKADDFLVEYSTSKPVVVATCDRLLRKRLSKVGIKSIFMRGKNHLGIA